MQNLFYVYKTLERHFYNSENWTDNQKKVFLDLYGLPPYKQTADYFYDKRRAQEWWNNNPDIEWHNPTNIPGADSSGSLLGAINYELSFVSKNVERLYK